MTSESKQSLSYALAKQVPDMQRGFRIETNYGELEIDGDDAQPFVELIERLLKQKLAVLR